MSESDELLIAELIDLPMIEREAFLSRACGHDVAMRERLVGKLELLMDSLSAPGMASQASTRSSPSEIAQALAAGLDVGEKPGTWIGHYQLRQKIGEGGCGIVYLAEQQRPVRRQVALKLIKLGLDTQEFVARFEAERQALALMDHPNIARVFDAGATEVGRPYFVMELVRGVPITRYCDENNLPLRERLRLFASVCRGVQHAHQKGIIHRDLKPSNILVMLHDGGPSPKIIDFGIAKAMGVRLADKTLLTQYHAFMGTPVYASPEQMELGGLDVDTRTDVYSLGVLLYELLTGRTPFEMRALMCAGLDAMRKTIREVEPPRPSLLLSTTEPGELNRIAMHRGIVPARLVQLIRGDLDWIVLKCLEKDPARRYETANGLAADLTRHLNDEPVVACPPSSVYRFQKLIRRNQLAVVAGTAVATALLLGTVASTWQAVQATQAKREALAAQAGEAAARARAQTQELIARQRAYASDMNVAMQALRGNNLGRAQDLLNRQRPKSGESDLRGWEWRYLWQQTRSDALSILCQKTEIESLAVSNDGRWLAIGVVHKDGLFVWDLQSRQEVAHLAQGKNNVRAVFSPVEPLLAFATYDETEGADKRIYLWNAATRQLVAELPSKGACAGLAFSKDGRTLVASTAASPMGHLTLWRVGDRAQLASFPSGQQVLLYPATGFSAASDLTVAAYGLQEQVHVVDLTTGRELWTAVASKNLVTALAFSPDRKMLATAGGFNESDIRLWDVATGTQVGRLDGHTSWVGSLVFWPDGKKLASSSADQTIRIWDVDGRTCTDVLRGHRQEVWRLVLLPDNRTLVSGAKDGTVCLWDASATHPRREHVTWPKNIRDWCFPPGIESVQTLDSEGSVARWSGPDFQEKELLLKVRVERLSHYNILSSDGRFVACASADGIISVWDVPRRTLAWVFRPAGNDVAPLRFHDGGTSLLVWSKIDNRLLDWSLTANREVQSGPAPRARLPSNGLSADETQWVVAGDDGDVSTWNLTKKTISKPRLDVLEAVAVAFAPSGRMLAMSSGLGYARIWDPVSWQNVATLGGYLSSVSSVAFSPDGNRLVTGSGSEAQALKLWVVDGWQEVLTLPAEGNLFLHAGFSSNGNAIGLGTLDDRLHVWRAPSWDEIEKIDAGERSATNAHQ